MGQPETSQPKRPDIDPRNGIVCPQCAKPTLGVTNTRYPCPGVIVRYRRCRLCGQRCKTRETVVSRES